MKTILEVGKKYRLSTWSETIYAECIKIHNDRYVMMEVDEFDDIDLLIYNFSPNKNWIPYIEPVKPVEWQTLLIEEWKKKRNQLLQTSKDYTEKEINYITPITKSIFDFQYTDISKTVEELEVEYEKIKLKLAAYESKERVNEKPVEWKTFIIETMGEEVPSRFINQYLSFDAAKEDNKTAITITEIKLNFEIL